MFYLAAGALLGPWGVGLLRVDALDDASGLERLTEIAVIISLFTAGLKLRLPVSDRRWRAAILLATVAMVLTIGGIAAFAVAALGLPLGAAVLLGALLAPTDPVLASDVQVEHEHDAEPVRFSLTGEAGLNDGTAFPFVMLGLGLMGTHELGAVRLALADDRPRVGGGRGTRRRARSAAPGSGSSCSTCAASIARRLDWTSSSRSDSSRSRTGSRCSLHAYGFLAVFAAGLSVRRIERQHSDVAPPADVADAGRSTEEQATDPDTAPAYMARAVLGFNEQLERLGELAVVLVVGAMLADIEVLGPGIWLAARLVRRHPAAGDDAHAVPHATVKTAACVHCMVRRARSWLGVLPGLRAVARRARAGRSDARGYHARRGRRVDRPARRVGDAADAAVFCPHP